MAMKIQILFLASWLVLAQSATDPDLEQRIVQMGPGKGPKNFPPARPTVKNIGNICQGGSKKLAEGIKDSVRSKTVSPEDALIDIGKALEVCCRISPNQRVGCAEKAWSDILRSMCTNQVSIKMEHDKCCFLKPDAQESCFDKKSPYPNYDFKN